MTHAERAESLRHCRWVDEVIENAPWVVTEEYINLHKVRRTLLCCKFLPYPEVLHR